MRKMVSTRKQIRCVFCVLFLFLSLVNVYDTEPARDLILLAIVLGVSFKRKRRPHRTCKPRRSCDLLVSHGGLKAHRWEKWRTYARARDAGTPRTGRLTIERSKHQTGQYLQVAINMFTAMQIHTQGKRASQDETQKDKRESDQELGAFSDSGEKWAARRGVPDFEQCGIHVLQLGVPLRFSILGRREALYRRGLIGN